MTLPSQLKPKAYLPAHLKSELDLTSPVGSGSSKKQVKLVQERLWLAGFKLKVDGDFGPATDQQLKAFQKKNNLPQSGVYDTKEHDLLTDPFVKAINPTGSGQALGDLIVTIAQQHIRQHPVEVGGDNCGPWVRMYMGGNEGAPWKWCAGFCFFAISQACDILRKSAPMPTSFSVNTIVERAKTSGQFLSEAQAQSANNRGRIVPGSLFVNRAGPGFWSHVGIVSKAAANTIATCEGNTNDDGSSNGYEAIERVRNYTKRDFIVW